MYLFSICCSLLSMQCILSSIHVCHWAHCFLTTSPKVHNTVAQPSQPYISKRLQFHWMRCQHRSSWSQYAGYWGVWDRGCPQFPTASYFLHGCNNIMISCISLIMLLCVSLYKTSYVYLNNIYIIYMLYIYIYMCVSVSLYPSVVNI